MFFCKLSSDSWNKVPQKERDRMGLNYEDDGEFWMEFNDFLYYFDEISICRIINTSVLSIRKTWAESTLFSKWSLPTRAGGCVNYRDTFCDNPQFLFEINHDDDKPDEVLINLDQLSRRADGKPNLTIGFFIMKVEDNRVYRLHDIQQKVASSTFVNSRSIFLRQKMTNGRYIIIPSTFEPNIEGKFMLRVYSDETNNLK
jgi:calpain-5